MIRSDLYDYSDAYIHVKGTMTVPNTGTAATPNNRNKYVIFKNYTPFTNYINEINNNQVDNAYDIDVVMSLRTFKVSLINCEISLMLTWSKNCFLVCRTAVNWEVIFKTTDAKLYVPVATLLTQNNVKLLKQLESGFRKQLIGININLKQHNRHEIDI